MSCSLTGRFTRGALLVLGMAGAVAAQAQSNWAQVAVPVYNPAHLVMGLHRHWTAPQSQALAAEATALTAAMVDHCARAGGPSPASLEAARRQWRTTVTAWERLSAVAIGPLVERRSIRQIDFTPTRPVLIERAIKAAPQGASAMERIGTPAKGFPALEWLLWTQPAAPGTPACTYAVEVARGIDREAVALRDAFRTLADRAQDDWDDEAAVNGMAEFVNQWVGALERLRWAQMEKPLRAGARQDLPRAASGTTPNSWQSHWQSVRALSQFAGEAAPLPGQGLVPIETYLRGRGLNALADELVSTVGKADARVQAAQAASTPSVLAAARELSALKRLAEAELAPALDVRIGFSDADGD